MRRKRELMRGREFEIEQALVERYNSTQDMTQAERAEKSANMVGLKFPKQFEQGDELPTMEQGDHRRQSAGEKGKGSLQTMFEQ